MNKDSGQVLNYFVKRLFNLQEKSYENEVQRTNRKQPEGTCLILLGQILDLFYILRSELQSKTQTPSNRTPCHIGH